jgi:lysozyme family protein
MKGSFEFAFAKVTSSHIEGSFSNDKNDPGGATKFGISQRSYPNVDIKNLTIDQAKAILRADYWDAVCGDELPDPLSHLVFDAAVNQGVHVAKCLMQEALGVKVDGVIGKVTLAAARGSTNKECAKFMSLRAMRYIGTKNFDIYGKGWFNRLFIMAMGGR